MAVRAKRKKQLGAKVSTRDLIITEAERIVADRGVDDLRLSEIADLVGIRLPSLYSHFSGRSAVIGEIIARALNSLADAFKGSDDLEPLDEIKQGARMLVKHLAAHPAYVRIMMLDFSSPEGLPEFSEKFGPPGKLEKSGLLRPLVDRLGLVLEQGEATGTLRYYEPLNFFHNLLGIILVRLSLDKRHRVISSESEMAALVGELEDSIEDYCERLLKI